MEASWLENRWARPLHLALVFCLALVLMQAVKLYLRRQRLLRDLRPFPGPTAHWLLGHQKFLQEDNMEKLDEIVKEYPCAFPCWVGPFQAFFYIYDPDYAKIFLSRTGRGLLNLDGPRWFQHRCLLTPAFHQDILKPCVDMMAHSVNMMLDKWEKTWTTQETTIEVFEHINLMTLDIIMKCAFGQETNCQINGTYESYVKATFELGEIISSRLYNFWHHHDIIFKLSPKGHCFQELGKVIHQCTGKNTGMSWAGDEKAFSDADLRSEVNTFMWAGHDASAASISWLLYCLALNPEHQDRCRTEIRSILGDGSSITWEQLDEIPYTTMCIKETLRLIPPIPSISRELSKPLTLPDGHSLPAGMTVVLSIWGLHHNPAVWKDPKVFDPLRFTKENSEQRHPCAFLPFSSGPRNCIGQQFAMLELKVAIALTLLRFRVAADLTRPPAFSSHTVLRPKHGIYLHLKKLPEC
ncbi:cytochrome P450 4X1, isoform CRA_b [Rattus norvegicus]|uniref:Cytochrome P450 4X1, isoform CRA_b n=1 Tax=Rattus norvegicus TaxID=10116 RepID=A6JZ35_RAT|nr:cytochrome P450 4X1, isoform CRA_b [Rattus norvegicus]